jgi:hypothetical protein
VLVRPDGYIGAIVHSRRMDALNRFLGEQGLISEGKRTTTLIASSN